MHTHSDSKQENKNQLAANSASQKQSGDEATFQFADNRPEVIVQRQLQEMANIYTVEHQQPIQKKNNTGLPDNLKSGIENLSGYAMDDVHVHYNSDKPAQLNAHAYAQGTDIHLASGQEKHLPHEAWHVVQQKQGRVQPTMQMKGPSTSLKNPISINDDIELEKEADMMGMKASIMGKHDPREPETDYKSISIRKEVGQRKKQGVEVIGLTHLVERNLDSDSIYEGEEADQVTEDNLLVVETNDIIISRRGPNQELFRKHDEFDEQKYEWYRVVSLDKKEIEEPGLYIRKDTFNYSKALDLEDQEFVEQARTRGSHKRVRLEVWRMLEGWADYGHLVMFDYETNMYYELHRDSNKVEEKHGIELPEWEEPDATKSSAEEKDTPVWNLINPEAEVRPFEDRPKLRELSSGPQKAPDWEGLDKKILDKKSMRKRQADKETRSKKPKYSYVDAASFVLTNDQHDALIAAFKLRADSALFHAYGSAQEKLDDAPEVKDKPLGSILVSRCLSFIDDLAKFLKVSTKGDEGKADEMLSAFSIKVSAAGPVLIKERKIDRKDGNKLKTEGRGVIKKGLVGSRGKGKPL